MCLWCDIRLYTYQNFMFYLLWLSFYQNFICLTCRFFGGLVDDIKRKAPFYKSDVVDALHVQSLASFVFLYFACLTPIITFGGLLGDATDNNMVRDLRNNRANVPHVNFT